MSMSTSPLGRGLSSLIPTKPSDSKPEIIATNNMPLDKGDRLLEVDINSI